MPPHARWNEQPLVLRFLLTGGAVMLAAMLVIGAWITARIEQSVVDNTASAAALYVESFISPLSQELAAGDSLSDPAQRALQEVFASTAIGDRIVSFKLWKPGGLVVHASDPAIVGTRFPPSDKLRAAWRGEISGSFGDLDDAENAAEAALGQPLLEVYSPIHEVWSGEIIAVAEFYEVATELERDLADARRGSWLLVAAVFCISGLMLLGIVRSGGRTIDRQKAQLQAQVAESRAVAAQNAELRQRAIGATARAAAQTEASLRRASADLHDGPAQLIALAAMRLDSLVPDTEAGRQEAAALREAMQSALSEIRAISRGLSLPDLGGVPLAEVARRAVEAHRRQTEAPIPLVWHGPEDPQCDDSFRICLYRFLQEALSNAARHAGEATVEVAAEATPGAVTVSVSDDGPGFDPAAAALTSDGGQGLAGLRDRAESIGGSLDIVTVRGRGTRLVLTLPLDKGDSA